MREREREREREQNNFNKCWVVKILFSVYYVYYTVVVTHVYFGGSKNV